MPLSYPPLQSVRAPHRYVTLERPLSQSTCSRPALYDRCARHNEKLAKISSLLLPVQRMAKQHARFQNLHAIHTKHAYAHLPQITKNPVLTGNSHRATPAAGAITCMAHGWTHARCAVLPAYVRAREGVVLAPPHKLSLNQP